MARWRFIASEIVFQNRWLTLNKKLYSLGNDPSIHDFYVVERSPFVLVVAIDEDGCVVMVRHYRHGTDKAYLELPAGYREPHESAGEAAQRELLEETGLAAATATLIGELDPLPGYVHSTAAVVLCEGIRHRTDEIDRDEIDQVVRIPVAEAIEMIVRGDICEMQAVAALLLTQARDRLAVSRFP